MRSGVIRHNTAGTQHSHLGVRLKSLGAVLKAGVDQPIAIIGANLAISCTWPLTPVFAYTVFSRCRR